MKYPPAKKRIKTKKLSNDANIKGPRNEPNKTEIIRNGGKIWKLFICVDVTKSVVIKPINSVAQCDERYYEPY